MRNGLFDRRTNAFVQSRPTEGDRLPRFSINTSLLYAEVPFLERFERSARAGFDTVEFWWPAADVLASVEEAVDDAGVGVALINFDAGDMASGDRGLLSDPARVDAFRANVPVALALAESLGCRMLNALVGLELPGFAREEQLALARENVAWAADEAISIGASVLIEAVNTIENGPYLISTTAEALEFVHSVGRPNVALQYDAYHMQRMEGNLTATLRAHIGDIAHIQIADSPGRGEPGTGEINFDFLLRAIDELGYEGLVGLEYRPSEGSTDDSLAWLPREARAAGATR